MIYKQLSYLPIIFQVDEGIINRLPDYLLRNKFSFNNILVVSGMSHSKNIAEKLVEDNNWNLYILPTNNFNEVDNLKAYCIKNAIDLIIGVGGGKVIDTVKRVSYLTNINHFSVPTIISNDGLISPIAVINNHEFKSESLPGMMPMGVLIDIDIIKDSPIEFIRAAAGDILTNISATNDWIIAFQNEKDTINDIAFHLAKSASNSLVHYKNINLKSKQFLRLVIQGQINSGIAMSLAGTSRPCSGSEHLLSHAIDFLGFSNNILHGTQVASISLFTLFLQGKLKKKHLKYAISTEIPLVFTDFLSNTSEETYRLIFKKAKEMRPGRISILDFISETQFISEIENYKSSLSTKFKINL